MLSKRAYYTVKPLIPCRLRLALRRWYAKPILKSCGDIWPIYERSGRSPENWPGWPERKQFAVVLTHDVESQRGLDRCRQLAEIEIEYGFRSSFNFIPNGEYKVPGELLAWLKSNGFEVGVHDFRHDGSLFRSRDAFRENSSAINRQLKEWGAVLFFPPKAYRICNIKGSRRRVSSFLAPIFRLNANLGSFPIRNRYRRTECRVHCLRHAVPALGQRAAAGDMDR